MPYDRLVRDPEEDPIPPPQSPPPPPVNGGGGIGPSGPPISNPPPPEPPVGPSGGGGGGAQLPPYPPFNIPGAPQFRYNPFVAPTQDQALNEPGYQFRVQQGTDALQRSAAAAGRLRTGGTLSDLVQYGQKFAADEYNNVYNRALGAYDRYYQGAHDAYAPEFARWQMRAQGERDAQSQRYNTELQRFLRDTAPGPQFNPEDYLPEAPIPNGGGGGNYPLPSGGDGPVQNQGDPWTRGRGVRMQGDPWTDQGLQGDPWTDQRAQGDPWTEHGMQGDPWTRRRQAY